MATGAVVCAAVARDNIAVESKNNFMSARKVKNTYTYAQVMHNVIKLLNKNALCY